MVLAYRQPGVKVTQEFVSLRPSLQAFQLPNVNVGPAFQIVDSDTLGNYLGLEIALPYVELGAGNIVDLRPDNPDLLSSEQLPVSVSFSKATLEVITVRTDGYADDTDLLEFKDAAVDAFSSILPGDVLLIDIGSSYIVAPRVDGSVTAIATDVLVGSDPVQYENVIVGDTVDITAGEGVQTPPVAATATTTFDISSFDLVTTILFDSFASLETPDFDVRADTAGTVGNGISLTFDGATTDVDAAVLTWNTANAGNTCAVISGGTFIPLVASTDPLINGESGLTASMFQSTNPGPTQNGATIPFILGDNFLTVADAFNLANAADPVEYIFSGAPGAIPVNTYVTAPATITLADGILSEPLSFTADVPSALGNAISLDMASGNIGEVVTAWNAGNPTNAITYTSAHPNTDYGNGNTTPVDLSGGADEVPGPVTPGTYTVVTKIDDQNIQLDTSFFSGTTGATDIEYSVSRMNSSANQGSYKVRLVVDANTLLLQAPLNVAEAYINYTINRDYLEIPLATTDYTTSPNDLTLITGITYDGFMVLSGEVVASYRALIPALASGVFQVENVSGLTAKFGVGQITPTNTLAFGMSLALKNAVTPTNGLGLGADYFTDELLAYQVAFDYLEATGMYTVTQLTNNVSVSGILKAHVIGMSNPDMGLERVGMISRTLKTNETILDTVLTSSERVIVNTQTDGIVAAGMNTLASPAGTFIKTQAGDIVTIVSGAGIVPGDYLVESVTDALEIVLDSFLATGSGINVTYYIKRLDGLEADGAVFFDSNATFITDGVTVGSFLEIEEPSPGVPSVPPPIDLLGTYAIVAVVSENELVITQVPGVTSVQGLITYNINRDLDRDEQATFLASYASSIGSRRVVCTWPDVLEIETSTGVEALPGYFTGSMIGALTTGFPPQQGFTNTSVVGVRGLQHSNNYFTRGQLNKIASGGVMILVQDVPEALPYIRHELTTDRTSVKFQEFMVTKNVDYIAKFMRNSFGSFIGKYNIVDSTYDELKSVSGSVIDYLKNQTTIKGIGGIIKSGSLKEIKEGASIDTINMKFGLDIPVPLNNIDIVIEV